MNRSTDLSPSEEPAPEEFDGEIVVACMILGLSFLVGAPGNLLVIWTILRHVRQRSHTVMLILHLAAADLLVLITLPLWIYSLVHGWVFGGALCKVLLYIIYVCMYSSIFFITLMGMERFLAICHPFVMMRWKSKSVMNKCLAFLWALALLLGVVALLTQPLDESGGNAEEMCFSREISSMTQRIISLCLETLGGFVVPFIILIICYSRVAAQLRTMRFNSKQKSMVLIHAVVIAFTLCWLPFHIINIIDLVCNLETEHDCVPQSIVYASGALVFISSSVNPVLYVLCARNLQGSLEESLLVRLFKEVVTQTNKLREHVVQQQTGQGAANTHVELRSQTESLKLSGDN